MLAKTVAVLTDLSFGNIIFYVCVDKIIYNLHQIFCISPLKWKRERRWKRRRRERERGSEKNVVEGGMLS